MAAVLDSIGGRRHRQRPSLSALERLQCVIGDAWLYGDGAVTQGTQSHEHRQPRPQQTMSFDSEYT